MYLMGNICDMESEYADKAARITDAEYTYGTLEKLEATRYKKIQIGIRDI